MTSLSLSPCFAVPMIAILVCGRALLCRADAPLPQGRLGGIVAAARLGCALALATVTVDWVALAVNPQAGPGAVLDISVLALVTGLSGAALVALRVVRVVATLRPDWLDDLPLPVSEAAGRVALPARRRGVLFRGVLTAVEGRHGLQQARNLCVVGAVPQFETESDSKGRRA